MAVTASMDIVLCALETSRYPHTVLRKHGAAHRCAPVRFRCGGGAAHGHPQGLVLEGQEREQASDHTRRGRAQRLCAHGRSSTPEMSHGRARWSGDTPRAPVRRQAHLLPALRAGKKCPERPRPSVATCHRPPEPAYAPRPARPCPVRVFSRSGPDIFGPQECCGGTGPLLRTRPT